MSIPKLLVDKDIAEHGSTMQAMMGLDEDIFSSRVLSTFLDSNKGAKAIELEINCNGGSTSETRVSFGMLETFKQEGGKVTTKGYKVNSSAVILFLAGDERLISKNADFIIHPVWIDPAGLPMQLEAEDMIAFGNEMKAEETKLLNIYCEVIGDDKRIEVAQLMANETNLSAQDAVRLGFATGILNEKKVKESNSKAIAFNSVMAEIIMNSKNQSNKEMAEEKTTIEKLFTTLNNAIDKLGTKNEAEETPEVPETQNASAELSEGGSVYFDGELAEGTSVFSDESMETPAPDGEHALADGKTLVVAGGVVSEVKAAASEEPETEDNKEVEALNVKVAALEAANVELLANQAKTLEVLDKTNELLSGMNNLVAGDNPKRIPRAQAPKDYKDMNNFQKLKYNELNGTR